MNNECFLCSVCGSSFLTFINLKDHVEMNHPSNLDELVLQRAACREVVFSCHVCSRKFRHKRFLRRHVHLHSLHGEYNEKRNLDSKAECEELEVHPDHTYMDAVVKYERDEFVEENDYICGNCGGIFSTLFNLRKHVRSKHPALLDTLAPRKKVGKFSCEECGKKFSHLKSVGRHKIGKHKSSPELKECEECGKLFLNLINFHKHMKNKHPDSLATLVLQGIKEGEFSCNTCGKVFSQRKNLRRHVIDKHKEASAYYTGKPVAIYQCPLCSFNKSGDVSLIMNHFRLDHGINVVIKAKDFDSKESFQKWKEDLELRTKSSYVKKAHVGLTSYFRCHRSGKYKPRGRGIRNIKMQGSNKIGGFCPAGMQVRIKDNKYSVRYSETHVGHTNDLKHLKLSSRERQSLASEISAQVPLDDILTNVRKSAGNSEEELARLSLVTKQDLTNIMRQYQLEGTAVRRSTIADSLDSWLLNSRHNVLYYKPQNCPDDEQPELYPQDFVLILMTQAQREILNRFGGGCVCLDRTDANVNRLHLSTMMVIDGVKSAFPVAFLISSRVDGEILEFFFMTVKQVVGDINPGLLFTDVAEDYYTAWVKVMGEPGQTLFSLWQVERDWRDNLYCLLDQNTLSESFLNFRVLMTESDPYMFHQRLNNLIALPRSDPFIQYFINNYSENYRYWSRAYRPKDALNVDANLERLHYSIRYLYTEVKRNQRLDRTIDSIQQFIENKLFEKVTNLEKHSNKKIKNIISGHRSSMMLNVKNILEINKSWHVWQFNKQVADYRIDEVDANCDCELKCDICNVCVHRFTCTCPDNVLRINMCKHIHLVCQFMSNDESSEQNKHVLQGYEGDNISSGYIGEVVIVETDDLKPDAFCNINIKTEISDQINNFSEESRDQSHILNEKKVMIASLSNEILQSINSIDEGDAFLQILKAAKPKVSSIRDDSEKTVYITEASDYDEIIPVKRVLYTAPSVGSQSPEYGNAIETHITLDSDGITLLSQAANFANSSN